MSNGETPALKFVPATFLVEHYPADGVVVSSVTLCQDALARGSDFDSFGGSDTVFRLVFFSRFFKSR